MNFDCTNKNYEDSISVSFDPISSLLQSVTRPIRNLSPDMTFEGVAGCQLPRSVIPELGYSGFVVNSF
jgi:hypothetical protein